MTASKTNRTMNNWRCTRCGHTLPRMGRVWQWRYQKHDPRRPTSGYLCDPCADRREGGEDY